MKLQCQVEVINRTHCSLNLRNNRKYKKSTLALGKEPKCETEFFILHFSTVNKSGTKYRVKDLKQVFLKCINDGKSTLRFEEPPHDLCIQSESIQLKCFMKLLKSCLSGDAKALKLAPLTSLSVTTIDNAPTKLVICDRSEFPSKGLPRTLETLCINGIKLCNFRREILFLKHLTYLDLSNNEIEKIPVEFGRMPSLSELYLGNNQLGMNEEVDWRWLLEPQISKTLKLLDLSDNKLKYLPKAMWKLENLITLNLNNNQLQRLPSCIGRINRLRYLTVTQNNLECLPGSLLQCRLEHIDISGNIPLKTEVTHKLIHSFPWEYCIGNLASLAAKVVLRHKLYYARNIIPQTLVEFLDNAKMCVCGAPAVVNIAPIEKQFELKHFIRVVVFDSNRSTNVVFECFPCSRRCFKEHFSQKYVAAVI